METKFRELVKDNDKFDGLTLEAFCALPDEDIKIYFDTSSIAGTTFTGQVLALRKRFRDEEQGKSKSHHICFNVIFVLNSPCDGTNSPRVLQNTLYMYRFNLPIFSIMSTLTRSLSYPY